MWRNTMLLTVGLGIIATGCSEGLWDDLNTGDCVEEKNLGGLLREDELSIVDCADLDANTHVYLVYWKGTVSDLDEPVDDNDLAYCADDSSAILVSRENEMVCYVSQDPELNS